MNKVTKVKNPRRVEAGKKAYESYKEKLLAMKKDIVNPTNPSSSFSTNSPNPSSSFTTNSPNPSSSFTTNSTNPSSSFDTTWLYVGGFVLVCGGGALYYFNCFPAITKKTSTTVAPNIPTKNALLIMR